MTKSNYQTDLEHALHLADIADEITVRHYRSSGLVITEKPDLTPVTQADTEVERALSQIVTTEYGEGYLGEEGTREGSGERVWIVDPIDGTRNYMRSMPIWASLIALREGDRTVAAVVSAPALGHRWWASLGGGSHTQDVDGTIRQLQVTNIANLADAFLLTSTLKLWDEVPTTQATVLQLINTVWRFRAPGDFLNYMLVAEGAADINIEPNPKQWDIEAPGLVVTEAGGKMWTSAAADAPAAEPRISVATNSQLQASVLEALHLTE